MNEPVTTETIISFLKECVENKVPIAPQTWVEAMEKLNVLVGDESDKLFDLQQMVAKLKVLFISQGDTVAKAKAKIEAEDIYVLAQKQKAKVEQIQEFIRIAKIQARFRQDEMKGY